MEIERRALYNLMRMNWLRDPSMAVTPWQVEDYRELSLNMLYQRLAVHGLKLDKEHFLSLAEEVDTPEELTALLLEDSDTPPEPTVYDQIYLLLFELWRRHVTDRPCLSIFCDELDYHIHHYDMEKPADDESIQDIISNLQTILDENADKGADPHSVFELFSSNCAHDLESFLYDYISDRLDTGNDTYANELLDGFIGYVSDIKWYEFLRLRLRMRDPGTDGKRLLLHLIDRYNDDRDLEFNLELLAYMVKAGNRELFIKMIKNTVPLLSIEADFQDVLDICADFFHFLDMEPQEDAVKKLIAGRASLDIESPFNPKDPALAQLISIL